GLDQRVVADPRVFTDLDAAKSVQLHARRISAGGVERHHLQQAVANAGETPLHEVVALFRSTYAASGPIFVRSSAGSSSKSNSIAKRCSSIRMISTTPKESIRPSSSRSNVGGTSL